MPEDHVAGLRVGPLEAPHLDAQAQAPARGIAAVGIEIPGVVVVVVQDHVAFLVGHDLLAEVAVPGAGPARIVDIVQAIGPEIGPGARVVAQGRRAAGVEHRVGLKIARPRLEAHDPVEEGAGALALAESGFHDVGFAAVDLGDLGQHEGRDAVAVVHAAALGHLDRVEDAQVHVAGVARVVTDHAVVPEVVRMLLASCWPARSASSRPRWSWGTGVTTSPTAAAARMMESSNIVINFDDGQLLLLNICLAFLMFGVSLDLRLQDFKKVLKAPKPLLVGLTSQLVLLPILTINLILIFKTAYTIQLGMLMVAACPGGNISNYMVYRSHGNTALSITMASVVTLSAVLVTPLSFLIWTKVLQTPPEFDRDITVDFLAMVLIIIEIILVPLAIGLLIQRYAPKVKAWIIKPVKIFSILLLLGIILFALLGNVEILKYHLATVFIIVLIYNRLAYALGFYFARVNRLDSRDVRAISLETGIQNSGLGLILIFNYFYGLGGMAVVAAWWGVWDIISGFALSSYWNFRKI